MVYGLWSYVIGVLDVKNEVLIPHGIIPTKNASCYRVLTGRLIFVAARALPSPHAHFVRSPLYFLHRMIAHELLPVRQFRTLGLGDFDTC